MKSRDLVANAVHFNGPDRLPFDMFGSGPSDTFNVSPWKRRQELVDDRYYVDPFGCVFDVLDKKTMGQPTKFPIKNRQDLENYEFPPALENGGDEVIEGQLTKAGDKYVKANVIWFTFFERMHFLHGFPETLEDLMLDTPFMLDLADRVIDYNIKTVREFAKRFNGRIHAVSMSDDWGNQTTTFISKKLFADFFSPRYRKLFRAIREEGMDVWLHSCGYVTEFIPMFIDDGVQVVNFQQPRIFDLAELGNKFAGSLCFNTPIDIQATMPRGDRQDIKDEAVELIRHLATEKGGFIANEHGDYVGNGIDPQMGPWAYQAFKEADPYTKTN